MNFSEKVCVITGGAKGIGLCIVNEFSRKGAKVAFIDLDREAGTKAMERIKSNGSEGLFFCGDIADKHTLELFSETVINIFGKVDYLINNACLSRRGILSGCDYDDFNYVLSVGVTAPYMLSKLFKNHFAENGAIINISSTRAVMSQPDTESYTAAKGGILSLTHALAVSLAGKVRVNCVSPGWIDASEGCNEKSDSEQRQKLEDKQSPADRYQHPVKRVGKPIDIANTVMFLCAEENSFITGENITVDGGMTRLMIYNDDHGWKYEPN